MRTDILALILEEARLGTRGGDIFIHSMPAECLQGILIKPPLSGVEIDNYLPGYFNSTMQIIVRAQKQLIGEDLITKAVAALRHDQSITYNEHPSGVFAMRINHMLPKNLPIRFPRSDGNGIEWSVNFMTSYVLA